MRSLTFLTLLFFLCTCVRAQNIIVTADIALADDYCTGPDPATDCISVPPGNDMLTYLPGEDGDILITYRITNNTAATVDRGSLTDSDRGVIIPVGPTNIGPGQTVSINRIFPGETLPRTVTATVTANLENSATGNSVTVTGQYTLEVVAPSVDTEVFLVKADGFCTDTTDLASCPVAPNPSPNTLTVYPGEVVYREYRLQNTGLSVVKEHSFTDSQYENTITTATANPGSDLRFRDLITAPFLPGTYPITVAYQGLDLAGNAVNRTLNYTLEVVAPMASPEVFLVKADGFCTDTTDLVSCPVAPITSPNTLTVYPGEIIYREYRLHNTGKVTLKTHEWDDSQYGITDDPATAAPESDLRFRKLIPAPFSPGTYPITVKYTGADALGNAYEQTINYTLEVVAPAADVEVFLLQADGFCTDTTDLVSCPVAPITSPNTLTVAPGETLYREYRLQNTGKVTLKTHEWDDSQYGITDDPATAAPESDLRFRKLIPAPATPGTHPITVEYTGADAFGNEYSQTISYTITTDCSLGDFVAPTAICQDLNITLAAGETATVTPAQINNGSSDNCGALVSGELDVSTFSCADAGDNTVTLTVEDPKGNTGSCTATVTVSVTEFVFPGEAGVCRDKDIAVSGGQAWQDIRLDNQLVAQVIIENNDIDGVRVGVYRDGITEGNGPDARLSRRVGLTMLKNGMEVQPDKNPVRVRLYYSAAEIQALLGAGGMNVGDMEVVKTANNDCGSGYQGQSATLMNTTVGNAGCGDQDYYFEFFTGTFSTFYLFAQGTSLPVELTAFSATALPKQRVLLEWTTATEFANDRFEIERSTDGRTFNFLGAVAGAGHAGTAKSYSYVDENPAIGISYYRLRQVDFDGTVTLSEIRQVAVTGGGVVSIFPNPTADYLRVSGVATGPVRIFDLRGRHVLQVSYAPQRRIDVRSLPVGTYFLQAGGETAKWVKK